MCYVILRYVDKNTLYHVLRSVAIKIKILTHQHTDAHNSFLPSLPPSHTHPHSFPLHTHSPSTSPPYTHNSPPLHKHPLTHSPLQPSSCPSMNVTVAPLLSQETPRTHHSTPCTTTRCPVLVTLIEDTLHVHMYTYTVIMIINGMMLIIFNLTVRIIIIIIRNRNNFRRILEN